VQSSHSQQLLIMHACYVHVSSLCHHSLRPSAKRLIIISFRIQPSIHISALNHTTASVPCRSNGRCWVSGWYEESLVDEVPLPAAAQPQEVIATLASDDQDSPLAASGLTNTWRHASAKTAVAGRAQTTEGSQLAAAAGTTAAGVVTGSIEPAFNYNLTIGYKRVPGTSRMEPRLAAVVVTLAAYSHVSPAILMNCVRSIEKQMTSVESAVKAMQHLLQQEQQQQQEELPP